MCLMATQLQYKILSPMRSHLETKASRVALFAAPLAVVNGILRQRRANKVSESDTTARHLTQTRLKKHFFFF